MGVWEPGLIEPRQLAFHYVSLSIIVGIFQNIVGNIPESGPPRPVIYHTISIRVNSF